MKLWERRLSYASPKSSICIVLESGYIWQAFSLFSHGFGTCQSTEAEWASCSNLNWENRCGFAFWYVCSLRLPWKYLWVISTPKLHRSHVDTSQLCYKRKYFTKSFFHFLFFYLVMLLQINSVLWTSIVEFIRIHFIPQNHPEVWVLICIIQTLESAKWEWERVTSQDFF